METNRLIDTSTGNVRAHRQNTNAGTTKLRSVGTIGSPLPFLHSFLTPPFSMATNECTSSTMNLSTGLGSTLAGVFVSLVLYGISILQTYVARAFYRVILDHFLLCRFLYYERSVQTCS